MLEVGLGECLEPGVSRPPKYQERRCTVEFPKPVKTL